MVAALAVPVVALATACGGSGGGADSEASGHDGHGHGHRSPLERLAIDQSELAGYTVTDRRDARSSGWPHSSEPKCRPLAHSIGKRLSPDAEDAFARVVRPVRHPESGVTVGLTSYPAAKARSAFAALEKAVRECGDGFDSTLNGKDVHYEKVRAGAVRRLGDQSLAYSMTAASRGRKILLNFAAVRSGSVITLFTGMNLKDQALGYRIPRELIDKQVAKVERAGRAPTEPRRTSPERAAGSKRPATGSAGPARTPAETGTGTATPEKSRTAPERSRATPEKSRTAPEKSRATPEKGRAAPEETRTAPEETRTAPEKGRATQGAGKRPAKPAPPAGSAKPHRTHVRPAATGRPATPGTGPAKPAHRPGAPEHRRTPDGRRSAHGAAGPGSAVGPTWWEHWAGAAEPPAPVLPPEPDIAAWLVEPELWTELFWWY